MGGRFRKWTAIAAALSTLLLVLITGASAQAAGSGSGFDLLQAQKPIGDGLMLRIFALGSSGKDELGLSISRDGPDASSWVDYSPLHPVPGRGPRFLRSRLGDRGAIAMRFRPSRRVAPGRSDCESSAWLSGHLVGHLRFRGEQRWVDLRETRIPATLSKIRDHPCPRQRRDRRGALLASCSEDGSTFLATRSPNGETGFAGSSPLRKRRGLYVRSEIALADTDGDFTYSPDLRRARVRPPDPFAGGASFAHRRLRSGLSFEPLHGPTAVIEDGDAYMERIGSGAYAFACVGYLPRAVAQLAELRTDATLQRLDSGR